MRSFPPALLALSLLAWAGPSASAADELVLARDKACDCQIVLPKTLPAPMIDSAISQAADVLREMFKSNGWAAPVVREDKADHSRPGIYLGDTAAARAAGVEAGTLPVWAYEWKRDGRKVIIAGRDWIAPGGQKGGRTACSLGSLKGLADFMRERCGTRFLAPGGLVGVEFLPVSRIVVGDGFDRRRQGMVHSNAGERTITDLASIGLNLLNGVTTEYFGHTHERAVPVDKYAHEHPEYFALVGGKRIREFDHPWKAGEKLKEPHLCYSNADVQELIYRDMLRSLDAGYPEYLSLQADGFQPCQCDPCRKLFDTADWGEKLWLLNLGWARRLLQDRPGKFLVVTSYTVTDKPPSSFREFPPNLRICLRGTPDAFNHWADHKVPGGFVAYLHGWGPYHLCGYLPVRTPLYSQKVVRLFAERNVKGVGLDSPPAMMWMLEGPAVYTYGRMFDDVERNTARELTAEYVAAAYGPAGRAMTAFFDELHHTLEAYAEVFGVDNGTFQTYKRGDGRTVRYLTWKDKLRLIALLYPPRTLEVLEGHLSRAEKTPALGDKHRLRLAMARREFDYLNSTARVVHVYHAWQVRRDAASWKQLLDELKARHAMIMTWYDTSRPHRPGTFLQKPIAPNWPMYIGGQGYFNTHLLANGGTYLAQPVPPFTWNVQELSESGPPAGADKL